MKSIIEQFANDSEYRSLIEGFSEKRIPCVISGMCDSARPFLVSAMLKDLGKKGVVIVPEEKEANAVIEVFRLFFDKVLFYPAQSQ